MLFSESPVRVSGVIKNRPEADIGLSSVVRDQEKFIRDWDRCISILPLKVFVPYSIFMKKTTCPMPNFNENNIENKTSCTVDLLLVPLDWTRWPTEAIVDSDRWIFKVQLCWNYRRQVSDSGSWEPLVWWYELIRIKKLKPCRIFCAYPQLGTSTKSISTVQILTFIIPAKFGYYWPCICRNIGQHVFSYRVSTTLSGRKRPPDNPSWSFCPFFLKFSKFSNILIILRTTEQIHFSLRLIEQDSRQRLS
jgi:hypothetical protein